MELLVVKNLPGDILAAGAALARAHIIGTPADAVDGDITRMVSPGFVVEVVVDVDPAGTGGQPVPLQHRHIPQDPEGLQHGAADEAVGGDDALAAPEGHTLHHGAIGEHAFAHGSHAAADGDLLQLLHAPEGIAAQGGDAVFNDDAENFLLHPGGFALGVVGHGSIAGDGQQTVVDLPGDALLRHGGGGDRDTVPPGFRGADTGHSQAQQHTGRQQQA